MSKSRDQLLTDFCKAATFETMTKVANDALATLQDLECEVAMAKSQLAQERDKNRRQAQMIADLNNALKRN